MLTGSIVLAGALVSEAWANDASRVAGPEPRHDAVAAESLLPAFDRHPAMWGLQELERNTRLADLDSSFALYLTERARFDDHDRDGRVYFAGGRQLHVEGRLDERAVADQLDAHSCLCALEYESDASAGSALHTAAGAYRLAAAPAVTAQEHGVVHVEFGFSAQGQSERVMLRRLVCWNGQDGSITPLAATLPAFAKLVRKAHAGFIDPPIDDRPVDDEGIARRSHQTERILAWTEDPDGLEWGGAIVGGPPDRWDEPELIGAARPGLTTFLRGVLSGASITIDSSGYCDDLDPYVRDLNRSQGIHYRDSTYWP